jgi:hypothetical protein
MRTDAVQLSAARRKNAVAIRRCHNAIRHIGEKSIRHGQPSHKASKESFCPTENNERKLIPHPTRPQAAPMEKTAVLTGCLWDGPMQKLYQR